MCQTTHMKILGLVTFYDLTLTLTWAKYETISLFSAYSWSLGVHMESFGRKMLRLRSLRSAAWIRPILTFDLTLTWHVTSILNFQSALEASRRDLSNAASPISLRPSFFETAGGRIRPSLLSRKRMVVERRARRHSKDLDKTHLNHFRKFDIEVRCQVSQVKGQNRVYSGCGP